MRWTEEGEVDLRTMAAANRLQTSPISAAQGFRRLSLVIKGCAAPLEETDR